MAVHADVAPVDVTERGGLYEGLVEGGVEAAHVVDRAALDLYRRERIVPRRPCLSSDRIEAAPRGLFLEVLACGLHADVGDAYSHLDGPLGAGVEGHVGARLCRQPVVVVVGPERWVVAERLPREGVLVGGRARLEELLAPRAECRERPAELRHEIQLVLVGLKAEAAAGGRSGHLPARRIDSHVGDSIALGAARGVDQDTRGPRRGIHHAGKPGAHRRGQLHVGRIGA